MLKDEEIIKPIFDGFAKFLRRDFSAAVLKEEAGYVSVPAQVLDKTPEHPSDLMAFPFGLNVQLFIIKKNFKNLFSDIVGQYMNVFPFIGKCDVKYHAELGGRKETRAAAMPIFCIQENNSKTWVPLPELASGMQKVLLIICDLLTLKTDSVYLIDEYENSLGVNAINFFPDLLEPIRSKSQVFITSHHPYLINSISPEHWLLLHRRGTDVTIRYGKSNKEHFSKSRQEWFTQLTNDPFYNEGIE